MERFIGGVLVNFKSKTFHAIFFKESPFPGGADLNYGAQRYKSVAHHTEGVKSPEELKAHIKALKENDKCKIIMSNKVYGWNGGEIPAAIEFFNWNEEEKVENIDKLVDLAVATMNVPLPEPEEDAK